MWFLYQLFRGELFLNNEIKNIKYKYEYIKYIHLHTEK